MGLAGLNQLEAELAGHRGWWRHLEAAQELQQQQRWDFAQETVQVTCTVP